MSDPTTSAVIGAGAWGTALANAVANGGNAVTLLARNADTARAINASRQSPRLPDVRIKDSVTVTSDPAALATSRIVLLAVPAQSLRGAVSMLAQHVTDGAIVVACAKGIERGTHKFMTEVIAEILPRATPAILSGPSFASDVARGLPTAITVATADEATAAGLAQALGSASFRPYHTTDVRGVEIGGAAKNVLAIAAGIVTGRRLGASAQAAMITRGFSELTRFGRALGAKPETLAGLSGLGDLVLSCSSPQSRNFAFGIALGEGESTADAAHGKLAEGVFTAAVMLDMAKACGVEMPIAEAVVAVLEQRASIDQAIEALMTRPLRAEG
jgi:glycerol-3-phosphate dehydrogenase (NAD(P)+)